MSPVLLTFGQREGFFTTTKKFSNSTTLSFFSSSNCVTLKSNIDSIFNPILSSVG